MELNFITEERLNELPVFEQFFTGIGFKGIDGRIYGLLALSDSSLSSEEIESTLNLSQSAISQSLKRLQIYGAITTQYCADKKVKVHLAKTDCLSVIASVFKKREQELVTSFKEMAERVMKYEKNRNRIDSLPYLRAQSIILCCEIAESVLEFVFTLAKFPKHSTVESIIRRLPQAFEYTVKTAKPIAEMGTSMKDYITKNIKEAFQSSRPQ